MLKKDFWYDLPRELIAQEPADPRDSARLMDGHFSAEVERFLGRNQIITAPERKKEKRIIQ